MVQDRIKPKTGADRTGPRSFSPVLGPLFSCFRSLVWSGFRPGGPVIGPDRTVSIVFLFSYVSLLASDSQGHHISSFFFFLQFCRVFFFFPQFSASLSRSALALESQLLFFSSSLPLALCVFAIRPISLDSSSSPRWLPVHFVVCSICSPLLARLWSLQPPAGARRLFHSVVAFHLVEVCLDLFIRHLFHSVVAFHLVEVCLNLFILLFLVLI